MKPATKQMIELALDSDDTVEEDLRGLIAAAMDGRFPKQESASADGPLLMTMTDAAKVLGVSRVTLWRMVKVGVVKPVEIMPGIRRIRREDLHRVSVNYGSYSPTPRGRVANRQQLTR